MTDNLPLISVVVPIYNVEKTLGRCVDSLLSQTYRNTEIVLVDDGSPDNCAQLCDSYASSDGRVKVVHRLNGGVSAARNSGVDNSNGEFIAFVDPDDYVSEDFLDFLYKLITDNGADISACGAAAVQPSGKINIEDADRSLHVVDRIEALERMCYNDGFYITLWDKLFKKSLFDGIRFTEGKLFEDTGTTYKLVDRAGKIAFCCETKYYYVISCDSSSITTSSFKMSKLDYVEMADEMADYITAKYPELTKAAQRKRMHACFSTLTQLINSGVRNKQVERMLTDRINALKKGALSDPRTPKRDRAALFALGFGFGFFSFAWKLYRKGK